MTFTDSTSTLRWLGPRPPVVAAATGPPAGTEVARVLIVDATAYPIAVIVFDEPAFMIDISAFWPVVTGADFGSTIVVEAVRGLKVVDRRSFAMSQASPAVISLSDSAGLTSVTLRYIRIGSSTDRPEEWVEIRSLRYRTVREERDRIADQGRCQVRGGSAGGGKLAWLPNHDYEVALTVRTTVDYQGSPQEAVVLQRTGFRTRGLPGLNAVESPGTELEPYVESSLSGQHRAVVSKRARRPGVRRAVQFPAAGRPNAVASGPRRADSAVGVGAGRRADGRSPALGAHRGLDRCASRHGTAATAMGAEGCRWSAGEVRRAAGTDDRTPAGPARGAGTVVTSVHGQRAAAAFLADPDPCSGRSGRQRPTDVAAAGNASGGGAREVGSTCLAAALRSTATRPH